MRKLKDKIRFNRLWLYFASKLKPINEKTDLHFMLHIKLIPSSVKLVKRYVTWEYERNYIYFKRT